MTESYLDKALRESRERCAHCENADPGHCTWEPRFRRMLERAKAALDEAHPITCTDNVDERCLICHALDQLEAIAKEGVTR